MDGKTCLFNEIEHNFLINWHSILLDEVEQAEDYAKILSDASVFTTRKRLNEAIITTIDHIEVCRSVFSSNLLAEGNMLNDAVRAYYSLTICT